MTERDLSGRVRLWAQEAGLDACGIATPGAITGLGDRLAAFIADGRHGDMEWMAETAERRSHPTRLWPETKSIIMLGLSYAPDHDPLDALENSQSGAISCYAQGKDYHDLFKGKLRQIARRLAETSGAAVKIFVDTAPLMEKPLAQAAGLGWQGKHTNLVSREHGSWLFLGAILTTAELEPDAPAGDHCGNCSRCLDVCPTRAFPAPYQLDARRCIAYLTIEHRGHIDLALRRPIGNRVFGCDDCLAVCPWNKFAAAASEVRFHARAETDHPPIAELLALDDAAFRKRFAGTPIKRTGRDRIVRNALIAAGNSGDRKLATAVLALAGDTSPLVRAMAAWAACVLLDPAEAAAQARQRLAVETDVAVIREWQRAEPEHRKLT
jgi:epoxyqueuosine reductase